MSMSAGRLAIFLTIVLSIWAAMHAYVFWRLSSILWVAAHFSRRSLVTIAVLLWASYPLARILESWKLHSFAWPLEYAAANWIGLLFLAFMAFLTAEVLTGGGRLFPGYARMVRTAAIAAAGTLFLIGLIQAFRRPVVREQDVVIKGLPPERDGLVLVQISDLHLGTLLGRRWLTALVEQVRELHPDMIVAVGDVVDGNVGRVQSLLHVLKDFRAPLGVWAVTGNHEYYAGLDRSLALFEPAGFKVLRDSAQESAPGLVVAGVDDLTTRRDLNLEQPPVETALKNRPPGATIFLSHTPLEADRAAAAGVALMLCGHTHNGQIWPFSYFVQLRYPLLGGRYAVQGMPVIVCRGTGTWGPRVRLFWPSEVVRIRLRAA
jgi:predicted MPP superfamily phosphohydrolase